MGLYLRDLPDFTLRQLANELRGNDREWGGVTNEINVGLDGDILSFRFGGHDVRATQDGVEQLASFTGIPRNFLLNVDPDMQHYILGNMLRRNPANVTLRFDETGVHEAYKPTQVRLDPRQIVDVAINTMGEEAQVAEWWLDDQLRIDVIVPDGSDRGIGGDPDVGQVGDITRGGIRFEQDRKNNHAPHVDTFLYRTLCTNGMVIPDTGLSIDARGSSVEVVLAELELAADHAFRQVEEQIAHFYAMRQQRIEGDVTQAVTRMGQERGLPQRTIVALANRVPDQLSAETLGHEPTMFDLVNLFTNQANQPELRTRRGPRAQLERAGGTFVREVHDRCGACHQVIA